MELFAYKSIGNPVLFIQICHLLRKPFDLAGTDPDAPKDGIQRIDLHLLAKQLPHLFFGSRLDVVRHRTAVILTGSDTRMARSPALCHLASLAALLLGSTCPPQIGCTFRSACSHGSVWPLWRVNVHQQLIISFRASDRIVVPVPLEDGPWVGHLSRTGLECLPLVSL